MAGPTRPPTAQRRRSCRSRIDPSAERLEARAGNRETAVMQADLDSFIADAKLRIEAELRERLDRQLELQAGAFDARRLFDAVVRQYERDVEARVERAQVNGEEELAEALDRMQREILPDAVESLRSEYRA